MISNTIRSYCKTPELIENYDVAKNSDLMWHCHHRLEDEGHSRRELIDKGMYYNRPPEELIFVEAHKHISEHSKQMVGEKNANYGKHFTEEHKRKIGDAQRGEKCRNWGKHLSDETKRKMSDGLRGRKWSESERKNHEKPIQEQYVMVEQWTEDGVLVAVHESMHLAAKSVNGSAGHICACCKGERRVHMGYVWKYRHAS